jgi:hypothetical protein
MEAEENLTPWQVSGAMTWRELGILAYRPTARFLGREVTVAYRLSAPALRGQPLESHDSFQLTHVQLRVILSIDAVGREDNRQLSCHRKATDLYVSLSFVGM